MSLVKENDLLKIEQLDDRLEMGDWEKYVSVLYFGHFGCLMKTSQSCQKDGDEDNEGKLQLEFTDEQL